MDIARVPFTSDDLYLLKLPDKKQQLESDYEYSRVRTYVYATRIILRREISPASLYLYLLARFGSPNGIISEQRKHDERARRSVLWHYSLDWRGRMVHFICHHFRVDMIFSRGQEVDITPEGFAKLLQEGLLRHRLEVDKARKLVDRYKSFLNPLSHMKDSIVRMLSRAEELDANLVRSRAHPETLEDIQWHVDNQENHSIAAAELSGCCLSVRMMSPVFAEMFVNLLIFNLFRDRKDREGEMAKFRKAGIIERIFGLTSNCEGFVRGPSKDAKPIQDFLDLMNRRNDLLHGNIKPEDRVESDFQLHDDVPTIMKFKPIYERALGPTLNAFPVAEARRDYGVALAFVQYMLTCLEDGQRAEFEPMLDSVDMHYSTHRKRVRVLYGNEFHESVDPELLQGKGPLPDWLR